MEEKPRDSAEIITKPIFGLMIIHMLLMGVAIELAYWLSFHGLIPLNSTNLAGIGFSNAVVKSGSVVHLQHMKARTMAFMVLFILESFFMPLQIRRINQPLKESLQDIDYKKEFLFYLPSVLLLLGAIYNLEVQAFIGNLGWTLNFMWLSITDWLLIAFLCIPAIFGFEIVRLMAKRKGIFF